MGGIALLKLEFQKLMDNKALLFALLGVLLVPIIYVAVLLSAKWGPYDNMDNLPVAFVNNDAGAISGGTPINVGHDLVETLKASPSLGWKFVTTEEAKKGLNGNDYYMVIEIPNDFSQRVTTVLDANPQVPEIHYTKNEGMNFMAAQVTNSAVERIREQLGDKITATFATTVFEKFPQIADGFLSGADGAKQIKAGTIQLADGTNTMLASLQEKEPQIVRLADGAKQADAGAAELLASVTNGTADINRLANGANEVANGVERLAAGVASIKGGTSQVVDGAERLADGAADLKSGTSQVAAGAERLAQGTTDVSTGAQTLATGATDLKNGAGRVLAGLQEAKTGSQHVLTGLDDVKSGVATVNDRLQELETGATHVHGGLAQLSTNVAGLVTQLQPLAATNPELGQQVQQLVEALQQLTGGAEQLKAGASQLVVGTSSQGPLAGGIEQLIAGQTSLSGGLTELVAGQTFVVGGTEQLVAGSNRLATGVEDLNTGAIHLAAGASQLDKGAANLQTGAVALKTGTGQVDVGAQQLNTGATTLAAGANQVAAGNEKLMASWGSLTTGVRSLKAGTAQIAEGNATVATGWRTLLDGTTQLNNGAIQLRDGSEQLAVGLEGGYTQVATVNASQDNISMFASPVTLVGEEVNAFSYYRDSTAPYVLSLALFVSLLILSFFIDFKKPASNPSSAFSWYLSKWLKLATFAVAQALILALFVLFVLSLDVTNVLLFILFTIFVSLTFMSLIFFLVAIGDNVGRFLGLAFIVVQLSITGSNLPVDMLPENLRMISKFLPLTYSNAGFKSIISLGDIAFLSSNMLVLGIYFIVASILALIVFLVSFKTSMANSSNSMVSES